jgi:hypothetical protein
MKKAIVITQWGEVFEDARYCRHTDLFYFKVSPGTWLNFEPQSIKIAKLIK